MTTISDRQLAEIHARDFLGDEVWKAWKLRYDECMSYRKSLRGKPTDEQREQLKANADWIAFCDTVLWHSHSLAQHGRCRCKKCVEKQP